MAMIIGVIFLTVWSIILAFFDMELIIKDYLFNSINGLKDRTIHLQVRMYYK